MPTAQLNPEVRQLYQHLIKRNIVQSEQPSMLPPRYTGAGRYREDVVAGTNPYYPMYHPELALDIHSGGTLRHHHPQLAHHRPRRVGGTNWDSIGKAFKGVVTDPKLKEMGLKLAKDLYHPKTTGGRRGRPRKHPVMSHMHGGGFYEDVTEGLMHLAKDKGVQQFAGELLADAVNGYGTHKKRVGGVHRKHPLVHHKRKGAGLNNALFGANFMGANKKAKTLNDIWGGARPRARRVHRRGGMKVPNWLKKTTGTVSALTGMTDPFNPTSKYQDVIDGAEYVSNLYNTDSVLDQFPSALEYVGAGRRRRVHHRRTGGSSCGGARGTRASIVKKVMQEHGFSLPQASSYVKQHGLY